MRSVIILSVAAVFVTAASLLAELPTKPEPLIKMSPGSDKIIGEPVIKDLPAMQAATVMEKAETFAPDSGYTMDEAGVSKAYESMMDDGFDKLMKWAHSTGTWPSGPAFAVYFEDPSMTEPGKLTTKVGFEVKGDVKGNADVRVEEIPAMHALVLQYQGPYEESNNAWTMVTDWMSNNGYEWSAPPMEIYLKGPMDTKDPKEYLTEIRVPIKKMETAPAQESETPAK